MHRTGYAELASSSESLPPTPPSVQRPLEIPRDLPGSQLPPLQLPPFDTKNPEARRSAIQQLYRELPVLRPEAYEPPSGRQMTLADLQALGIARNPAIRQAAADVESARGNAIQAGAIPNPQVSYQADNMGTGGTAGYQGVGISQTIPTGGKLRLGQQAACAELQSAELNLQKARYDLATQVRTNYFAVLVAQEKVKVNRALAEFAETIYRTQIGRVRANEAAPYEPLLVRVLAVQARAQVVQAENDYAAAWRRMAATLNSPELAPAPLAGPIDAPLPILSYEEAAERLLSAHTDLAVARNGITKARYQLELARRTPVLPDLNFTTAIQKDYTTPPFGTAVNVQLGAPIPLFDKNRGNILAAEAALLRACSEPDRVRDDLLSNLADRFARYETSRVTFDYYRTEMLFDQVRAYRGLYLAYQKTPDRVQFTDLVTAQQTLTQTVAGYVQALGDRWQALVDLAGLLQVDDLFQMGPPEDNNLEARSSKSETTSKDPRTEIQEADPSA